MKILMKNTFFQLAKGRFTSIDLSQSFAIFLYVFTILSIPLSAQVDSESNNEFPDQSLQMLPLPENARPLESILPKGAMEDPKTTPLYIDSNRYKTDLKVNTQTREV